MLALLGAAFFAAAAFLGMVLADAIANGIRPFEDGPAPGTPPTALLLVGSAAIGAIVATHAAPMQIGFIAVLWVALIAIWFVDVRTGIVPNVFTLGPLAIILAVALLQRDWMLLISMAIPVLPFALAAGLSKGRGMGWGDVKLVALGAAVLGAQVATLAFAAACICAVVLAYAKHRAAQPIAFAPYLAGAIALAIPVSALL